MQTVGATAASGVRLKERVVPETGTNALDEPGNAERFGVRAIVPRAEGGRAQPVVTGSAVGSRWWSVASDRRWFIRPARVVARATENGNAKVSHGSGEIVLLRAE